MNLLECLQNWYLSNCDGDWEHSYGVQIYTLDNPGWAVKIDLIGTCLEESQFNLIQNYVNENNWIYCNVGDGLFKGSGSFDKLEEILRIFLEWEKKVCNEIDC
jgi:hypothetical protein